MLIHLPTLSTMYVCKILGRYFPLPAPIQLHTTPSSHSTTWPNKLAMALLARLAASLLISPNLYSWNVSPPPEKESPPTKKRGSMLLFKKKWGEKLWMFSRLFRGAWNSPRIRWVVVGDEWCWRILEQESWSLQMFEAGINFQQSWQNNNWNYWNGQGYYRSLWTDDVLTSTKSNS